MIEAKTTELLEVPESVAKCPECGSKLVMDIYENELESRQITEEGFHLYCENEYQQCFIENNWEAEHRGWQAEWQPVKDTVFTWLSNNVRVAK